MPIVYDKWINRQHVKANPSHRFVFGDNVRRLGTGGQAAFMRGEPNAIGVATKWAPSNSPGSFFSDQQPQAWAYLRADLAKVQAALRDGRVVHVPRDGIGTGLSRLPQVAPEMYALLRGSFQAWSGGDCPWPTST